MAKSYFEGIQKKAYEKPDLSYLFNTSNKYGSWGCEHKNKNKKEKQFKNFLKDYEDYQNGEEL